MIRTARRAIFATVLAGTVVALNLVAALADSGFAFTGSLNQARQGHTATLLSDGRVLVAGGYAPGTGYLATAEIYDPATESWTYTGSLATARSDHMASLLPGGSVLVTGGLTSSGVTASAEIYDPASGSWSPAGSMGTARFLHRAVSFNDGRVLISGGCCDPAQPQTALSTAEIYDPSDGSFSPTGDMGGPRESHAAVLLGDGTVLVAAGSTFQHKTALATAEVYDPGSSSWTRVGDMTAARRGGVSATILGNGQVLTAGGYRGGCCSSSTAAEIYDPVARTWQAAASLDEPRGGHADFRLGNGTVLVAGGYDCCLGPSVTATSTVYDPVGDSWSPGPSLNLARYVGSVTPLGDGRVLIAAGVGMSGTTATAELYRP